MPSASKQQDRTQHAGALRFDNAEQRIERLVERRASSNELQDLILSREQLRVLTGRLFRLLTLGDLVKEDR